MVTAFEVSLHLVLISFFFQVIIEFQLLILVVLV